jgi:hypothetical protein
LRYVKRYAHALGYKRRRIMRALHRKGRRSGDRWDGEPYEIRIRAPRRGAFGRLKR